jgi:hypothetical protein
MPKFPKVLYVRIDEDGDEHYFVSWDKFVDAIDGDGPTQIGVYNLDHITKARKVVEELG